MIFITWSLKTKRVSLEYEKPEKTQCLSAGDYTFFGNNPGTRVWFVMPDQDEVHLTVNYVSNTDTYDVSFNMGNPFDEFGDNCEIVSTNTFNLGDGFSVKKEHIINRHLIYTTEDEYSVAAINTLVYTFMRDNDNTPVLK